jgi:hypothetical protein
MSNYKRRQVGAWGIAYIWSDLKEGGMRLKIAQIWNRKMDIESKKNENLGRGGKSPRANGGRGEGAQKGWERRRIFECAEWEENALEEDHRRSLLFGEMRTIRSGCRFYSLSPTKNPVATPIFPHHFIPPRGCHIFPTFLDQN